MSKSAEYSRSAEECSKMAASAKTDVERAAWLKIAESWLRLAGSLETQDDSDESQFDSAVEHQASVHARSVRQH